MCRRLCPSKSRKAQSFWLHRRFVARTKPSKQIRPTQQLVPRMGRAHATCRNGSKDVSFIENFGPDLVEYAEEHDEVYQHCVCPEGFFGVKCEHEVEICPGNDFVCMHGSKCVPSDAPGETYECDCDEGFTPSQRVAGKYCQYKSTDICTKGGTLGVGIAMHAFCVNGGQCKDYVNENQK